MMTDTKKDMRQHRRDFMAHSREMKLTLGDEFICCGRTLRLIKVTPKGFNLLVVEDNRTILKRHLYALGWGGKKIPNSQKTFKFRISDYVSNYLREKKKQ